MESPPPENISISRKKAIKELLQGREFATQLQILINKPDEDHGSISADDLLTKILGSFMEALLVLNSGESSEVCQNLVTSGVSSPWSDDRKSQDSGESRKGPALKDRRGGYNKRRKSNIHSWTKLSPTLIDDGYAWRKYGQKDILNAKYPRSYFRCTHRYDQGCEATKQVQRIEEDPQVYRTIYMGHHRCQYLVKPTPLKDTSYPFSFGSNVSIKPQNPFFSSIKQECKEEIFSDLTHNNNTHSYLLSPDLSTFEMESTGPTSDTGDLVSGLYLSSTASSHGGFDLEMMVGSVDIDDVFHFDDEFF